MYGVYHKQWHFHCFCKPLQLPTEAFCWVHCLQVVRRTPCQTANLFRLLEHTLWSPLKSMVTYSSPFPVTALEVNTTSTPLFSSRVATGLSCFSPFPLVEPSPGIHLWLAVKRSWVWPIITATVGNTKPIQLCTRPLVHGSSTIKRFQLMEPLVWRHLNTGGILTLQWRSITTDRNTTSTAPCTSGSKANSGEPGWRNLIKSISIVIWSKVSPDFYNIVDIGDISLHIVDIFWKVWYKVW